MACVLQESQTLKDNLDAYNAAALQAQEDPQVSLPPPPRHPARALHMRFLSLGGPCVGRRHFLQCRSGTCFVLWSTVQATCQHQFFCDVLCGLFEPLASTKFFVMYCVACSGHLSAPNFL